MKVNKKSLAEGRALTDEEVEAAREDVASILVQLERAYPTASDKQKQVTRAQLRMMIALAERECGAMIRETLRKLEGRTV